MDTKLDKIIAELESSSARNIDIFNLINNEQITNYVIICSASSKANAQGIANSIEKLSYNLNEKIYNIEGYKNAEWILIDYNDIVLHIFREESRNFYKLDELLNKFLLHEESIK